MANCKAHLTNNVQPMAK
jgi:hypothetical protein